MENARLKIWLNFWKFFFGSVVVTLISIYLNNQIQQNRLDLEAQSVEDKYVQEHLASYMETGYEQRLDLVNFLRFLTVNEKRKENYDSLYLFLKQEIKNKELKISLETDSILKLKNKLNTQLELWDDKEKELADLKEKYKNANSDEKPELQKILNQKKLTLDSIEYGVSLNANKIEEKESLTRKIQRDIDNPINNDLVTSLPMVLNTPYKFDLKKGTSVNLDTIEVTFSAQKVNNITKRALIKIETGESNNNPTYYLAVNKFCVFEKSKIKYKLLNTGIYNDGGYGHSHVKLELSNYH